MAAFQPFVSVMYCSTVVSVQCCCRIW